MEMLTSWIQLKIIGIPVKQAISPSPDPHHKGAVDRDFMHSSNFRGTTKKHLLGNTGADHSGQAGLL